MRPSRTLDSAPPPREAREEWRPGWHPLLALIAVASALRLYRINEQVWHDEVSILVTSLRRPLHEIATQWPGPASHVLFELSARLSIMAFGEAPFALRLPAVVFGVAGVVAFYWLALLLLRRDQAFALGMLYAVSYFHVWFSQNARGYTAMMLFFVLVSALLVRAWQRRRIERGAGIAYALTGAMTAYSHPVGLAVVPVQAAVVAVAARTAGRSTGQGSTFPLRTYLAYAALALLLTVLLYLPFVPSLLTFTRDVADAPGSGPRAAAGVLGAVIEGLSAATLGVGGLAVATAVGLIGLAVARRRFPFALAVLVLPLVAQGVTFVALGIGINPRYFAMALPVVVLIGGAGVIVIVEWLAAWLARESRLARRLSHAMLATVVLLSALPLIRYYSAPKQDYLGAIDYVERAAAPRDERVGVYLAEHIINGHYQAGFAAAENLEELRAIEARARGRVWLVTTLERILHAQHPDLHDHIQRHYTRDALLPATLGDGQMRIYVRDLSVVDPER